MQKHLTIDEETRREVLVFKAGARLLGLFADEAGPPVAWRRPTPLPRAPRAVLGVVSVRGRMLTVLEPLSLLDQEHPTRLDQRGPESFEAQQDSESFVNVKGSDSKALIIPLRNDEQLALAVEAEKGSVEIALDQLGPERADDSGLNVVRGHLQTPDGEVALLDVRRLFAAAVQGMERRRKRF